MLLFKGCRNVGIQAMTHSVTKHPDRCLRPLVFIACISLAAFDTLLLMVTLIVATPIMITLMTH
jgi:hypothetical protein